jgi:hypothetical protein
MTKRLLAGDALIRRAKELGVSIDSDRTVETNRQIRIAPAPGYEIQRRVLEAERALAPWYAKPIGIVFLGIIASLIAATIRWRYVGQ